MLNGKLYAQWEVMCSTGNYNVLHRNLGAQWEVIMYSTGHYWGAQWEIIMCSTGHYWSPQWEFKCSTGSAPWEINGVHIVVVVNNIPNVKQSPSKVLSHMNLMCGFWMEGWIELRTW